MFESLRSKIRNLRNETYLSTLPIVTPRAAGAAMMFSPRLFLTEEASKLLGRKQGESEVPEAATGAESHDLYREKWDGVERVAFYLNDDIEIVLYNTNPSVRVGDLTGAEQVKLVLEGLYDFHIKSDDFLRNTPWT
jgi:hypothetical protein